MHQVSIYLCRSKDNFFILFDIVLIIFLFIKLYYFCITVSFILFIGLFILYLIHAFLLFLCLEDGQIIQIDCVSIHKLPGR